MTILEHTVNGQPGLIAQQDGITVTVFAFDIAGGRIKHIWAVRNPDKLPALDGALTRICLLPGYCAGSSTASGWSTAWPPTCTGPRSGARDPKRKASASGRHLPLRQQPRYGYENVMPNS